MFKLAVVLLANTMPILSLSLSAKEFHLQNGPQFPHTWDKLPVFWFSANLSAIENQAEQALIAKYVAAAAALSLAAHILSPHTLTNF